MPGAATRTLADRIAGKFTVLDDGCWQWHGSIRPDGYGSMSVDGKTKLAHRASLMSVDIEVPDGLVLDHLCRNRACVNPDHLEPVTIAQNTLRGESPWAENARKTHCQRGHEFTAANTGAQRGGRFCKACRRAEKHKPWDKVKKAAYDRRRKAAKRAAKLPRATAMQSADDGGGL